MQLDLSRFSPAERSTLQLRVLYEGAGYRKFRCSHFEEYSLYQQNERFLSDSQSLPLPTWTASCAPSSPM